MQLELVQFIKANPNWEELLQKEPYCLTISRDTLLGKNLVMFKYSQIDSDFSQEIVKESRGLILEDGTWEIVSYPFRKFMNYGEPTADQIDWSTASVQEKIDGSLIKVVRIGDNLLISTNGTIDAFKAPIQNQLGCKYASFGELVSDLLKSHLGNSFPTIFREGFTYMFELVSPWTRVVIPYPNPELYYLGSRYNQTFQEKFGGNSMLALFFPTPKCFDFGSFEACLKNASELPWDQEGYVVCDGNFNRVKVKSPAWIQIHHMADNGNLSYARCLELIRNNEIGEVLAYFPEYRDQLDSLKKSYEELVQRDVDNWNLFQKEVGPEKSRKEKAIWIISHFKVPASAFSVLDGKLKSVEEWYRTCSIDSLIRLLDLK